MRNAKAFIKHSKSTNVKRQFNLIQFNQFNSTQDSLQVIIRVFDVVFMI